MLFMSLNISCFNYAYFLLLILILLIQCLRTFKHKNMQKYFFSFFFSKVFSVLLFLVHFGNFMTFISLNKSFFNLAT